MVFSTNNRDNLDGKNGQTLSFLSYQIPSFSCLIRRPGFNTWMQVYENYLGGTSTNYRRVVYWRSSMVRHWFFCCLWSCQLRHWSSTIFQSKCKLEDDRKQFHERFKLTAHTLEPFASYTRFKCKPSSASSLTSSSPSTSAPVGIPETSQIVNSPQSVNQDQSHNSNQKELLFEVNGNLLFGPETSEKYAHLNGNNSSEVPKFFCFMAKPYPSRNMAMLVSTDLFNIEDQFLANRRPISNL